MERWISLTNFSKQDIHLGPFIGCYRSAISAYHRPINDLKVGVHPRVHELMKGVFNNGPPNPQYIFIKDIHRVLDFIKENWPYNKDF